MRQAETTSRLRQRLGEAWWARAMSNYSCRCGSDHDGDHWRRRCCGSALFRCRRIEISVQHNASSRECRCDGHEKDRFTAPCAACFRQSAVDAENDEPNDENAREHPVRSAPGNPVIRTPYSPPESLRTLTGTVARKRGPVNQREVAGGLGSGRSASVRTYLFRKKSFFRLPKPCAPLQQVNRQRAVRGRTVILRRSWSGFGDNP